MYQIKKTIFKGGFVFSLTFCLLFLLFFPKESFNAALKGLVLWFRMIIPALLPFAILSNIFIRFRIANYFSFLLEPILGRLFKVHKEGCFCILAGFLFGYPMGAKIANDLVVDQQISKQEGEYLFLFCNQASPAFILNYVALNGLKNEKMFLPVFIILILSAFTLGILLRIFIYNKNLNIISQELKVSHREITSPFELLDQCIMNGIETILKLGAYIIVFSIFVKMVEIMLKDFHALKALCIGILEMTNGIAYLTTLNNSFETQFLLALFCVSFGGISCIFQTAAMVKSSHFSISKYLIAKIMTAFFTVFYGYIYLNFIY